MSELGMTFRLGPGVPLELVMEVVREACERAGGDTASLTVEERGEDENGIRTYFASARRKAFA